MPTVEDKLDRLRTQRAELLAQEKKLLAQQKELDRKSRTRRLIAIGAGVESVLQHPIEGQELTGFLDFIRVNYSRS